MKTRIIIGIGAGIITSLLGHQLSAQGLSSAGLELLKQQKLWFHSSNAAGAVFEDSRNYSDLQIGYNVTDGNFHRPQQGNKNKTLNVDTEGFLKLKGAYVWGSFAFKQENTHDAGYNASITDPFRGMPYYVADSLLSNWRNQYYDMKFRVATPLYWGKVAFGIEGTYQASLAAKQRDPRVDTRFYTLQLVPGVTYQITPQHRVGANVTYASIKEDSQMENINASLSQTYYELYGLGVAVKGIGSGRTTNYHGNRVGAGVQYNYRSSDVDLLFEGNYAKKVENVDVSYSTPKRDAAVNDQRWRAALSMYKTGNEHSHFAKVAYLYQDIKGIQYLNQRDNSLAQQGWLELYHSIRSTYDTQQASADYSFIRNRGDEYDWKIDVAARYTKQTDKYILPYSEKVSENLFIEVAGKKNFVVGKTLNKRLLAVIRAGYNNNLSGHYLYGGSHADYVTVTGLEQSDINYLTSDFYKLGVSVAYSQQIKAESQTNVFAKANFNYVKTSDFDFDHRSYVTVCVGCNF